MEKMDLSAALALTDDVLGELQSLGHPRSPTETITCATNLVKAMKKAGVSTVDDAIATLVQFQPIVTRKTGE